MLGMLGYKWNLEESILDFTFLPTSQEFLTRNSKIEIEFLFPFTPDFDPFLFNAAAAFCAWNLKQPILLNAQRFLHKSVAIAHSSSYDLFCENPSN